MTAFILKPHMQRWYRSALSGGPGSSANEFTNIWTGALTDESITIAADSLWSDPYRVLVTEDADTDFESPVYTSPLLTVSAVDKDGGGSHYICKHTVTGLSANTAYRYALVRGGKALNPQNVGTFKTAPPKGVPTPFKFAFGSCSRYEDGNDTVAAEGILADEPAFFLHLGDLSYDDYTGTSVTTKRSLFYRQYLSFEKVQELHRHVPIVYTWSDHDSTANDLHRGSTISGTTYDDVIARAQQVYKEGVPHYPLLVEGTLLQTFWWGSVFFVIADPISTRDLTQDQETALGEAQFNAIVQAVSDAVDEGATMIVYGDGMTWINRSGTGKWADWRDEQTALLDALAEIPNMPLLVIVNGDTHALGADDGSNCDFSTGGMRIVNFQAAPLRQSTNNSGGPFSWLGVNTYNSSNNRAYGLAEVSEDGKNVKVTFKARNDGNGLPEPIATYDTEELVPLPTNKIAGYWNFNVRQSCFAEGAFDGPPVTRAEPDGPLGTARDLSGNGLHMVATSEPRMTNYGEDGGKFFAHFITQEGNKERLSAEGISGFGRLRAVAVAFRPTDPVTSSSPGATLMGWGTTPQLIGLGAFTSDADGEVFGGGSSEAGYWVAYEPASISGDNIIIWVDRGDETREDVVFLNGQPVSVDQVDGDTPFEDIPAFSFGERISTSGGSEPYFGRVYTGILFTEPLSDDDVVKLTEWLQKQMPAG